MDGQLASSSIEQLRSLYARRKISPVEVVQAYLARIEAYNPTLNAFVLVDSEGALDAAREAEREMMRSTVLPPLFGIPASVKDNIMTAGLRSASGSRLFRDHVPATDSGVVRALRKAGGIVIGKTNTSAFGWNATTVNMLFGPTRNPWNATRTAGGSSGGAAVAAATCLAPINIGTDGGGSLRVPAAFTGTVGFKPSHGRVADVPPHTHWIIQHYGPVARTVGDAALILDAIAGPDARDPHSLPKARIGIDSASPARPLKVLFTTQLGFCPKVDAEIVALCHDALDAFRIMQCDVSEKDLAWPDPAPFANVIAAAGLAGRLRPFADRLDEVEDGIRDAVRRAERFGPLDFYEACVARNAWCTHAAELFEDIDLMVTPTTACRPFGVDETAPATIDGHPVEGSSWASFLRAFNLTGNPAVSVPCGMTTDGLPVGLQIVGRRHHDNLVLSVASAFEALRPWKTGRSPMDVRPACADPDPCPTNHVAKP